MQRKFFEGVSIVFHPIFIPSWLIAFFMFIHPGHLLLFYIPIKFKLSLMGLIFVYSSVLPVTLIRVLEKFGLIDSFRLHSRKDRFLALILIAGIYGALTYFFHSKGSILLSLQNLFLFFTIQILILGIISYFQKVSLHSMSIGTVTLLLMGIFFKYQDSSMQYYAIGSLVLSGLVMTARLYLDAHTPKEISQGFQLGLASTLIFCFFGL
ncbi:MAG: hypothetical protein ACRCVT_12165 [Leadbetterella sp.]